MPTQRHNQSLCRILLEGTIPYYDTIILHTRLKPDDESITYSLIYITFRAPEDVAQGVELQGKITHDGFTENIDYQ